MTPQDTPPWFAAGALAGLSPAARATLAAITPRRLSRGTTVFRPGDRAQGFVVVLSGRIEVFLTGPSGREIMLYAVEPGQSCIQTTLGLMAGEDYTGEAMAATDVTAALIPRDRFAALMDSDHAFRTFVLQAFARRMADVTRLLERVAFGRIESRLARALVDMARDGTVQSTHADLAARIGSAREVVSRRLETMARAGLLSTDRGQIRLHDLPALRALAAAGDPG